MADLSYILRERKRRADRCCIHCAGEGSLSYTASGGSGEAEGPCLCVMREGDFSEPDPLADETASDARELARERS